MVAETEEYMIDCIERLASDIDLRKKVWEKDYETVKTQLFWEEHQNVKKYVNSYLSLLGRRLP
jgi:spore maturation protein CgeB